MVISTPHSESLKEFDQSEGVLSELFKVIQMVISQLPLTSVTSTALSLTNFVCYFRVIQQISVICG